MIKPDLTCHETYPFDLNSGPKKYVTNGLGQAQSSRRINSIHYMLKFEIWNLGHAQRRRLRRVLRFIWNLGFEIWNLTNFLLANKAQLYQSDLFNDFKNLVVFPHPFLDL